MPVLIFCVERRYRNKATSHSGFLFDSTIICCWVEYWFGSTGIIY